MSIFNEKQIKAMTSGRIVSNGHYKTNNVGVKNETNTASAMGNVFR